MKEYTIIEKVGISQKSFSDAIKNVIHNMKNKIYWFEVVEQRGRIDSENKIEYQVKIKIGLD